MARLDSFHFVHNPSFATTNNTYLRWLARGWVERVDFVCLNADVLYHPDILPPAIAMDWLFSMIVDPEWREETMKVVMHEGNVVFMSKAISRNEYCARYIGITTFSREVTTTLFREIGAMIAEGRTKEFFDATVQRLIKRDLHGGFTSTRGLPWAEIDDPVDFEFARSTVCPLLPRRPLTWGDESVLAPKVA